MADMDEYITKSQVIHLRQMRAELLDLQELLDKVIKGEVTLEDYAGYIVKTKKDISAILNIKNPDTFNAGSSIGGGSDFTANIKTADIIRSIENMWEQIETNPLMKKFTDSQENFSSSEGTSKASSIAATAGSTAAKSAVETDSTDNSNSTDKSNDELKTQEMLHHINMINDRIRKMVFLQSLLTIPERLNRWLENAPTGYYIPFHLVFEDELPNAEDRVKVLKYLAYSPKRIEKGIICAGSGLIYKCETSLPNQLKYAIYPLLVFVALTGAIIYSGNLKSGIAIPFITRFNASNFPDPSTLLIQSNWPNPSTLLICWLAVLVGIAVHAAVGAAKVEQKDGYPPLISVKGILPYVSAKSGWLVWKQVLALVGFIGLAYASTTTSDTTFGAPAAFLVGYSLDSIVELFGVSMEQKAKAQVGVLKKQLNVAEE